MSLKLSSSETALISSIIEKNLNKLLLYKESLDRKEGFNESTRRRERLEEEPCGELGKANLIVDWLKNVLCCTLDEMSLTNGEFERLAEVVSEHQEQFEYSGSSGFDLPEESGWSEVEQREQEWSGENLQELDLSETNGRIELSDTESSKLLNWSSEEEYLRSSISFNPFDLESSNSVGFRSKKSLDKGEPDDEKLLQQIADVESAIRSCPINEIDLYKQIMTDLRSARWQTHQEWVQNGLQIQHETEGLQRRLEEAKYKTGVEERTMVLQKKFLLGEVKERSADTDSWYKRFFQDRDSLNANLVKVREDIESLQERSREVEQEFIQKRALLEEHRARAKQREVRIESEAPVRALQTWWRGTLVRLSLGKFHTKFADLRVAVQKRKEEEAKFLKKLKQKYGGGGGDTKKKKK